MCAALQGHGVPASDLSVIGPTSGDPLGSGLVISTAVVRSQLGTRLAQVYAPAVIAAFGTGQSLIQVRVVVPGGAAAYFPALRADNKARIAAGRELSRNPRIEAAPAAQHQLASGQVDSRLLVTLAALAGKFGVRIANFGAAGPGSASSDPLQTMSLTVPADGCQQLLGFLAAQRAPLRAQVYTRCGSRTASVRIRFSEPSPVGLLTATTTP